MPRVITDVETAHATVDDGEMTPAIHQHRTPCRGQPKTGLASILSATAINLIRIDAWRNGTPLGTARVSHLARLDPAA